MKTAAQQAFEAIARQLTAKPLDCSYSPTWLLRRAGPGVTLTLEPKSRATWLQRRTA